MHRLEGVGHQKVFGVSAQVPQLLCPQGRCAGSDDHVPAAVGPDGLIHLPLDRQVLGDRLKHKGAPRQRRRVICNGHPLQRRRLGGLRGQAGGDQVVPVPGHRLAAPLLPAFGVADDHRFTAVSNGQRRLAAADGPGPVNTDLLLHGFVPSPRPEPHVFSPPAAVPLTGSPH